MKEKILESLKTKYKTLGFSDKAFNGVADFLAKTVTDETTIETSITGVEGLLKAFQGEYDRLRNENAELKKSVKPETKTEEKVDKDKPLTLDDIQKLLDERDNKAKAVQTFEQTKAQVIESLKSKGAKQSLLNLLASQITDQTLSKDAIEEKLQKEYDTYASDLAPEAGRPSGSSGVGGNSSSEVDDFLAEKKAEREKQTKTN